MEGSGHQTPTTSQPYNLFARELNHSFQNGVSHVSYEKCLWMRWAEHSIMLIRGKLYFEHTAYLWAVPMQGAF